MEGDELKDHPRSVMPTRPIESTVPCIRPSGWVCTCGGGMSLRSSKAGNPWTIGMTVFAAAMLLVAAAQS